MALTGIVLRLSGGQLSDLFFNFEHPKRDALYKVNDKVPINTDELSAAIRSDAAEFAAVIGVEDDPEFVEALAADFEHRV